MNSWARHRARARVAAGVSSDPLRMQRRNHIEQQKQLVEAKRKEVRAQKGAAAAADSLTCAHLDDVLKVCPPPPRPSHRPSISCMIPTC